MFLLTDRLLANRRGLAVPRPRAVARAKQIAPAAVTVGGLAMLAFLLTWHQAVWNIQDWDEARHIVSAVEMMQSGDWLVNTYRGAPDLWNLKPPVSFWAVGASMEVFGANPIAMHLPSILATMGTAVMSGLFARRRAGAWAGAFTVLAIASCAPLINAHTGRTADPDALYICAITAVVLASIEAVQDARFMPVATLAFSVAFLTKSWHSLLALAFAACVYFVLARRHRISGRLMAASLLGFLPLLAWVVARYLADGTTFLFKMVQYDLLSRSGTPLEGHYAPKTFYLTQVEGAMGIWLAAGALGLGFYLNSPLRSMEAFKERLTPQRAVLMLSIWIAAVLVAFSAVSTKLYWYVACAYPAACIVCGIGIALGLQSARQRSLLRWVPAILGCIAFATGAQALRVEISTVTDNAAQLAIWSIGQDAQRDRAHVYLDPSVGTWSQSLVAVAESADLQPEDGGPRVQERGERSYVLTTAASGLHVPPGTASSARVLTSTGPYVVYRLVGAG